MPDYSEQKNERETLFSVEKGNVKSFRHTDGKTFFCEQLDDYIVDERIARLLDGETIEKQMNYYVTASRKLYETAYGEITKEELSEKAIALADYKGVKNFFLRGNRNCSRINFD